MGVSERPINRLSQLRSLILAVFFGVFSVALSSCGEVRETPPDLLRLYMSSEPDTLNPLLAMDAYAANVNGYLYDTLIERDRDTLQFKPKMAERWEVSPDNKIFTFTLRRGIVWEDGRPFTAADVVFSFNAIKDPRVKAAHISSYYQDIESVTAKDDYKVVFVFSKVYFKALTFAGEMQLLPKHIWEKELDKMEASQYSRRPIGIGPYKFKEWLTDKKIVLERNELYWGAKPEIRTIEFRLVHDDKIALQLLKKGELDEFGLSTLQWTKLTDSPQFAKMFRKVEYPAAGYSYIGWNMQRAPFDDVSVRQAMTRLVDRVKISQKLYFGLAQPITGPFAPYSNQYNTAVQLISYDPIAAAKLLDQAGWRDSDGDGTRDKNGKKFEFEFLIPSGSPAEKIAIIFKEELDRVGVRMNIVTMEWAAFLERLDKKDFDATSLGWSASVDSDPYQIWHSSQATTSSGSNFVSFRNAEADRLMDVARVTFDEKVRNEYFHELHKIIADAQPYTFLFNVSAHAAVSRRFENVIVHKLGLDTLEWQVKH